MLLRSLLLSKSTAISYMTCKLPEKSLGILALPLVDDLYAIIRTTRVRVAIVLHGQANIVVLFVVLQHLGVLIIIIVHLLTPDLLQLSYLLGIILGHVAAY